MPVSKILSDWKKNKFEPIYWLEGDETFYIDQVVEYAEKYILTEEQQSFNLSIFYGKDASWADIVNACQRYPIFSDKQVVVIKEAQYMNKIEELQNYFENPLSSTILVVAYKEKNIDGRKAFGKMLKTKTVFVATKKMYDNQLPDWVMHYVVDSGYKITPKAVQIIVDHIGNDLSRIQNELQKLMINLGDRKQINEEDIEKYIGISKEYNAFEFQDAIGQKNFTKAIKMIQYFESNNKAAPIQLILPTLYSFFSKVYMIYGLGSKDERKIASELGMNPYVVKNYTQALHLYSYNKVQQILLLIQQYNLKVLGINDASNEDADLLKELVVKIMDSSLK